jgi:hypothetical protein
LLIKTICAEWKGSLNKSRAVKLFASCRRSCRIWESLRNYVQEMKAEWVLNLDEVDIFEWEDQRSKKSVEQSTISHDLILYGSEGHRPATSDQFRRNQYIWKLFIT